MRQKKTGIYLIILCVILSIANNNESIIYTQGIKVTGNYNQVKNNQVIQNNYFPPTVLPKTNNSQAFNRTAFIKPSLQATTSTNTDSNITGFISTWQTNITSPTSSNSNQIKLPLVSNGVYNFNVSWGDGNSNLITVYNQSAVTHTYSNPGIYTVNIIGTIVGWSFNGSVEAPKLLQISNWGPLRLKNAGYYFSGASNLYLSTTDTLDLNGTTNLSGMFMNCNSLGGSGDLNSWNVSQVTNMAYMFAFDEGFNQPLDTWNVSQVTNMSHMFYNEGGNFLGTFNQPLNSWDTSHVTDMSYMFANTFNFNQPLNSWNVSQVTDMSYMFANTFNFSQPLDSWNVLHVTDMRSMFYTTFNFNQPLNSWNVSHVTDMSYMFSGAQNFNQPLNSWNVSHVTDMSYMFSGAQKFNQPLNSWNVSQVTEMNFFCDFLSISNYDKLLLGWSSLSHLQNYVVFDAGNSQYSNSAQNARKNLIKKFGWTITDGGLYNGTSSKTASGFLLPNVILSQISSFTSHGIVGLTVITLIAVIVISALVSLAYIEYRRTKAKGHHKYLNFWDYLKNIAKSKRHKTVTKETLSNETFDKIEQIIDENKE